MQFPGFGKCQLLHLTTRWNLIELFFLISDLVQIRSKLEDLQQSSAALHSAGNLASTSFIPSLTETDLTTHTEDPETTRLLLENIPLATETNLSQAMNSGEGRNYHDAKSAAEENSPASSDEVSL